MEQHVRILGWSYIALAGVAWFILLSFNPADMDASLFALSVTVTLICAIPVVGAIGLLRLESWALGWMLLISALSLALYAYILPALLGVYGLWVLSRPETKMLFGDTGHRQRPTA